MDKSKVFEILKGIPTFSDLDERVINYLIDESELRKIETDSFLFRKDEPTNHMHVILQGSVQMYFMQNNEMVKVSVLERGSITGVLPYSRMKVATGYGQALETCTILSFHRDKFRGLENVSYELMQNLVGLMSTRIRDFTAQQQQNEKLMALGKLSAGLSHELNNPASAIVRGSSALKKHLAYTPARFKAVIKIRVSDEQVDDVNKFVSELINSPKKDLTLIQKSALEDELTEWLSNFKVEDPYGMAETLTEYQVSLEELEELRSCITDEFISPVLGWIENVLVTEKLVSEIEESSRRIADLVGAVKNYSHMDRGSNKEETDIRAGIKSTLVMLGYKAKKKKINVSTTFPEDFLTICAQPGQLNQVWTNLIDNAIDAVPEGGTLHISGENIPNGVRIMVEDNGSGIPKDIQGKIFDPFFTTKAVGQGTGLGLDVVMKIIKSHKGEIKVQSETGKTVFTVILPEG